MATTATGQRKNQKGTKLTKDWDELNKGDEFSKLHKQEKIAMFTTAFRQHDKDGSGVIDAEELLKLVQEMFPNHPTRLHNTYVETLLKEVDTDSDGQLQYEEFVVRAAESELITSLFDRMERANRVEAEFKQMDVDGSGQVDEKELESLIAKAFPRTGEVMRTKYLKAILLDTDKDRSGFITMDELLSSDYFFLLVDADEEPVPETAPKKVVRKTKKKTAGVGGGMAQRCDDLSPKRRDKVGTKPTAGKPRVTVERLEAEDFKPMGLTGDQLMEMAEGELESHAGVNQWNDAQEYFEDAAVQYLRDGEYLGAGFAFTRCSEVLGKLGRPLESANTLVKAAEAYRLVNPEEAIQTLDEAIDVYEDHDMTRMVARLYRLIAEIYEGAGNFPDSIDNYLQSAEQYQAEDDMTMKAKCLRKAAQLHAASGDYSDAIEVYESLANMTLENKMTGAPVFGRLEEFYFRAVICHIANADQTTGCARLAGIEKAEQKLAKYQDIDFDTECREYQLCGLIMEYAKTLNTTAMHAQIDDFIDARKPEKWLADLLNLIASQLDNWLEHTGLGASK